MSKNEKKKIVFRTLSLTSLRRRWVNSAYTIYDYHTVITYVFLSLLFVHLTGNHGLFIDF